MPLAEHRTNMIRKPQRSSAVRSDGNFRKKMFALGAGACLILACAATWAGSAKQVERARCAESPMSSNPKLVSHLIIHGIHFDGSNGQMDPGSRAVLDYAIETMKSDRQVVAMVGQPLGDEGPDACGMSQAQAKAVTRYIKRNGIAVGRVTLCQPRSTDEQNSDTPLVIDLVKVDRPRRSHAS